ncbi:MAG: hypothetical protein R6X25_00095 [Candidatus Krumholzibacteriia bacterium]
MKKVSLLLALLLAWTCLTAVDTPVWAAGAEDPAASDPGGSVRTDPDGGINADGDPDDIIEGNRRLEGGNAPPAPVPAFQSTSPWLQDLIVHVRLLICLQR